MDKIKLRKANSSDISFLKEMLYEAVFWRKNENTPSFEEGLKFPEVVKILDSFLKRENDAAVIATINSIPVGAAWFRFWKDEDEMRGYINKDIPVLVIAIKKEYRHKGIGKKLINWLIEYCKNNSIDKISLSVTKDNYAINLYRQQGFKEYKDMGDWFIMVYNVNNK